MSCKNAYMKSAQCAYNNTAQTVSSTGTTLSLIGTVATDTGIAISTNANGFTIERGGLYRFSADVMFAAGAAGTLTAQMNRDGTVLPCTQTAVTAANGGVYPIHMETVLMIRTCPLNTPVISVYLSGVDGTVSHISANAVKIA